MQHDNRQDLYERVKLVKGKDFITVEDTETLNTEEIITLISDLVNDASITPISSLNILVNSKFPDEVDNFLKGNGFQFDDQVVTVFKILLMEKENNTGFTFKSLHDVAREEFVHIWEQTMVGSVNSSSSSCIEKQMQNVELELGPTYNDSCLIAYVGDKAVGVVMPHIEPGTKNEGRLFYFGLIPSERGKGISKPLHLQAIQLLKNDFHASFYIGSTSVKNKPMLTTFMNNGCTELKRYRIYKRKR